MELALLRERVNVDYIHLNVCNYRFDKHSAFFRDSVWQAYPQSARASMLMTRTLLANVLKNSKLVAQYDIAINDAAGVKETVSISPLGAVGKMLKVELRFNACEMGIIPAPAHCLPAPFLAGLAAEQIKEGKKRQYFDSYDRAVCDESFLVANLQEFFTSLGADVKGVRKVHRYGATYQLHLNACANANIEIILYRGRE